jgi:membrane protein
MKNFFRFCVKLIKTSDENDLFSLASELTYNLILAFFPFLIFLMSLVGFFNIDSQSFLQGIGDALPDAIYEFLLVFVKEVVAVKNPGVLSLSLIVTVFSASSGLLAVMRGVNKAYGQQETRHFIITRIVSIVLVLILALGILLSIASIVFIDVLYNWLCGHIGLTPPMHFVFAAFVHLITVLILLSAIIMIYRLANSKKVPIKSILPGALTTLCVWFIASRIFNIYVNHFARYASIYGSIAGVFILMYWLNIISVILLIGGEINALLYKDRWENADKKTGAA